jgi:arginase
MDGDLDLNTPATTASGILDGMVMAHVLGKARSAAANISSGAALVAEEDIVLFGYSTEAGWIETHELRQASAGRMIKFPLESLQSDIRGQARQAISQLENQVDRYLVHCDVDVVDSTDFDAADLPHSPGLTLEQTTVALEEFLSSSKAAGLVITEFNGRRDQDGVLASRLAETVMAAVRRLSK